MSTALAADRSRVCTFTFDHGNKCRLPLFDHPYLCTFHARRAAEERATDDALADIAAPLSHRYVSYNSVSSAIANTITALAYNHIPTRTAATIAYLTQNLVHALAGAEREYQEAFGTDSWRQTIAENFNAPRPGENHSSSGLKQSSSYSDDANRGPAAENATEYEQNGAEPQVIADADTDMPAISDDCANQANFTQEVMTLYQAGGTATPKAGGSAAKNVNNPNDPADQRKTGTASPRPSPQQVTAALTHLRQDLESPKPPISCAEKHPTQHPKPKPPRRVLSAPSHARSSNHLYNKPPQ